MPRQDEDNHVTSTTHSICNVGIVGFGTVGRSVAKILSSGAHRNLRLTHICNRNIDRKRVDWVDSGVRWTDRFEDILTADVHVVVEVIGGVSPAAEWMRAALEAGKSVVTANKQVVAQHGRELFQLARQRGGQIGFEACVAGGIPVIRGVQEGLAGDRLVEICGVLNGTCNFVLTRMERSDARFADAVKEAQTLGLAEADPTDDFEGVDAQAKLAILSAVGLQRWIEAADIPRRPITDIEPIDFVHARRLECTIRQVSRVALDPTDDASVRATVLPALVPQSSLLARVTGSQNIVVTRGTFSGEMAFVGLGAGGDATAVAVVSDLESIAVGGGGAGTARFPKPGAAYTVRHHFASRHYVRFAIGQYSGGGQLVADRFVRHGAHVDRLWEEMAETDGQTCVVVTDCCDSSIVGETILALEAEAPGARLGVWLPILDEDEAGHSTVETTAAAVAHAGDTRAVNRSREGRP